MFSFEFKFKFKLKLEMSKASLDYLFLYELLTGKNVENQTLESISSAVQKRFSKSDYLSGKFIVKITQERTDW